MGVQSSLVIYDNRCRDQCSLRFNSLNFLLYHNACMRAASNSNRFRYSFRLTGFYIMLHCKVRLDTQHVQKQTAVKPHYKVSVCAENRMDHLINKRETCNRDKRIYLKLHGSLNAPHWNSFSVLSLRHTSRFRKESKKSIILICSFKNLPSQVIKTSACFRSPRTPIAGSPTRGKHAYPHRMIKYLCS